MAINNEINIKLNAQDKASKSFDKLSKSSKGLSGKLKLLGGPMKKIAIGLGAAGVAAGAVGIKMFNMADGLETSIGKAKTVFGDYFDDMDKFAQETGKAMGLSRGEFLKTAAGIQDLLIPMGFTREAATGMTQDMLGLSGALSEWSAGQYSAAEVGDIMAKAMLGEREQLKSLGIAISEEDVKTQMLADSKAGLTYATEQQAKAMATQALIFAKSTDAQESFAKGADSLTRKKAELSATLKNTQETIAQALLPAFHEIIKTIQPIIEKVAESIKLWFENKQNVEKLTATLRAIGGVFKVVFKIVGTIIKIFYKLGEAIGFVAFKVIETAGKIKDFAKDAKEWGSNLVSMFIEGLTAKITALKDKVVGIATTISDYLGFHSPTKKGPASDSDKWMPNFIKMLSSGLNSGKAKVSRAAMELSTSLSTAFGNGFGMEKIQTLLDTFESSFQTSLSNIDTKINDTKNNIGTLKNEIEGLNSALSGLKDQKKSSKEDTRSSLAERALEIEKELEDKTIEYFKKKELLAELQLAKEQAGEKALTEAREWSQMSESERIIQMGDNKRKAINDEIREVKTALVEKMELLKQEEDALLIMHNQKIEFENQYHTLFQKNSSERLLSIEQSITAMKRLNSLKSSSSTSGTKANGGPVQAGQSYVVGERGREMFVPNTSGTIVPAGGSGMGNSISIGNISLPNVSNGRDFVKELENMARLQKLGIT